MNWWFLIAVVRVWIPQDWRSFSLGGNRGHRPAKLGFLESAVRQPWGFPRFSPREKFLQSCGIQTLTTAIKNHQFIFSYSDPDLKRLIFNQVVDSIIN